jgi:hypothetical protein
MADQPAQQQNEAAKQRLAEEKKVSDKSKADFVERMKGKPTPTQEENDLAALGATFTEHEPDGSDPDPGITANKQLDPKKPAGTAGYQTRQATPTPPAKG